MCTIITVSQLTMSKVPCSVQNLNVGFSPRVVSNHLTSSVVVQRSTPTMSTEELTLIQIRHQDISTKNKTVTLLANILHFVLWRNHTKLQKCFFYCKGWCHRELYALRFLLSAIKLHQSDFPGNSSKQKTVWMWMLQSLQRFSTVRQSEFLCLLIILKFYKFW